MAELDKQVNALGQWMGARGLTGVGIWEQEEDEEPGKAQEGPEAQDGKPADPRLSEEARGNPQWRNDVKALFKQVGETVGVTVLDPEVDDWPDTANQGCQTR